MRGVRFAGCLGVVVAAFTPAACGNSFTAGPSDAGGDGSIPGDGSTAETGSGDADAGVEASSVEGGDATANGHIVYVSMSGDDTATGLDPAHPKKTVTAGLAAAKVLPGPAEVHVCKGTYTEDGVLVDFDVKLEGVYDCTTWTRTTTYGYPHPDGVDLTLLASPDTTAQEAAIVVTGPVTRAAVIDGLAITGAPTTSAHTDGVRVTGSASPTLSNDVIAGGSGQAAVSTGATGSIGILVDAQAAPEIEGCFVSGGLGRGTVGSTGVVLDSTGGVSLHDSIATGGTGQTLVTSGASAIGVDVRTALTTPLSSLIVSGTDQAGTSGQSIGVRIAGASVTAVVAGCFIEGGLGLDTSATSVGLVIDAPSGGITLSGDRVYGGQRTFGTQQTVGVFVLAAGSLTIENTLVHAGTVQNASGAYTVGIDLDAVASPVLAFDTVYTGAAAGTAIAFNPGVTGALIRDDLILGSDATIGSIGVATTMCGGMIASLDHTAFGNLQLLYQCANGGDPPTQAANLTELGLTLGAAESNDVAVQGVCVSADATCATFVGCPGTSAACLPGIFGSTWSSDDGISSLFGQSGPDAGAPVQGWTLVPGAACTIASGGTMYGGVTTDAYGAKRAPMTPTMGAVEYTVSKKCGVN